MVTADSKKHMEFARHEAQHYFVYKCGVYIQEDAPHVHMTAKERRLGKQVEHDLMGVIEGK